MELQNERDARFLVHHQVTEKKLLHLERGVRKLGFSSGGRKILLALLALAVICTLVAGIVDGVAARMVMAVDIICVLAFIAGVYSLFKAWFDAKKDIHIQYEAGKKDGNYEWEYRFYENCYEVIGKNEMARVQYSNLGRLLEFTGMLVLVEKGNVVRYFMKEDIERGSADEFVTFLERKSGTKLELVSVR